MQANTAQAWRFADCRVDAARRELRRDGVPVDVQPRVFDLLVYLLRNHDRAVDKDELQDAVWPGMFITETALTRAVMKARKAVGDDANRQAVIKTVHGHGYRFVAELLPTDTADSPPDRPVVPAAAPPDVPEAALSPAPAVAAAGHAPEEGPGALQRPAADRRRGRLLWLSVAAALLLLAGAWFLLRPPATLAAETRVAVLPLVDETGDPELAWTRLGLMSYASNLLGSEGDLPVVPEGSVIGLVDHFGWNGALEDEANTQLIDKLRRVYGASHVLALRLEPDGRALRMNFELLAPDGALQRGTVVGEEATDLAEGVAQSVYGSLLGRRRSARDVPLVSADPFNNEAFARGMDFSLQGRCADALPFFRVIVEQEPGLFAPRYEYASCLRILGRNEPAEALLDELVAEQRLVGPGRPLAQALMTLGILRNRTGRLDEAQAAHEEALSVARSMGDRDLEAQVLHNLSIVYEDRGEFARAEELLDLSHLAYQDAGREVMPGQLWSAKANLRMDQGQLPEAEVFLGRALEAFRAVGDLRNEAMMLNNTGYLLRSMGRMAEAEEYHLRSLEIREEIGDRVGTGRVYGMLSVVYTALGRFEEAVEAGAAALEIARETQDRLFEGTALAHLADAERARGDLAAARRNFEASRAVFEAIGDRMRVLQCDLRLARIDLEEGRGARAETEALRVLEAARAAGQLQPEVEALELLGDAALARGAPAEAAAEFEAALQRARPAGWSGKERDLLTRLVGIHLDAGDIEAAGPLVGALSALEPDPPALEARARYAWGRGEREQAIRLMEEARALAGSAWSREEEAVLTTYRGD